MKSSKLTILALAGLLGVAFTPPALLLAQDRASDNSNSQSMSNRQSMNENGAGQNYQENGAANKGMMAKTGDSLKHAYHATKNELSDAALTTRVKAALLEDHATKKYTIHVKSDRGTVTLAGEVDSPAAAAQAQHVASNVKGVSSVNNHLTWHTSQR